MNAIIVVPYLRDNYCYIYTCGKQALVVDPGDALAVLKIVHKNDLEVCGIATTHHHYDHIAGVRDVQNETKCNVYGKSKHYLPSITHEVSQNDEIRIGDAHIRVIETPGHTNTSVSYYLIPSHNHPQGIVWTGDSLFIGGCGRIREEGSASALWKSLQILSGLPDDTLVYCGHEYSLENFEFALVIDCENNLFLQRLNALEQLVKKERKPSVPSTIGEERNSNPFLLADSSYMRTQLSMNDAPAENVFAELRRRKDFF